MIICVCHGVNDTALDTIVESGASSLRDVGDACGAGTDCGQCCRDILAALRRRKASLQPTSAERAPLSK